MNDRKRLLLSAQGEHPRRLTFITMLLLLVITVVAAAPPAHSQGEPPKPDAPRIVGGREAEPGEWPWQVALVYAGGDPYDDQYCGGTLISPLWVVTAAHCVEDTWLNGVQVLAGIHNLVDTDPGYVRLNVADIIVHPAYGQANQYDSDIALLELSTPAPFRTPSASGLPIAAAALVLESVGPLTGVESTVTGWGNRLPGGRDYPATLHEVEVPIVSNAECRNAYGDDITDAMLCAGVPEGGKDSCQGDSGGPLVVFSTARSRWELAGIVSWGTGCAQPGVPGVYTRVSSFIRWIADETGVSNPDFFLTVSPAALEVCGGATAQTTIELTAAGGFDDPVTLSLVGMPPGGNASFQPTTLTPPATSTLSLATTTVPPGNYSLLVRGTSGNVIHGAGLALSVAEQPAAPQLLQPLPNALDLTIAPLFVWSAVPGADRYRLEIATQPTFQDVIYSATSQDTQHGLDEWLEPESRYYWRVRAENVCGAGTFSRVSRLTTGRAYCRTPNRPVPDFDPVGVTDTLTVNAPGTLADLEVFLRIDHEYAGDLSAWLSRPSGGQAVALFSPHWNCSTISVLMTLDDESAVPAAEACTTVAAPPLSGFLRPDEPLSTFDGQPLAGTWQLQVSDTGQNAIGTLNEWCVLPSLATSWCDSVTDVPAAECEALESLFTATDGWRWANRANWLDTTKACQWQGVTCAGGHVTGLQLDDNGLSGLVPPSIGQLPQLRTLDLSGNSGLIGPLPMTMTDLPLTRFWFNDTALCSPAHGHFAVWLSGIDDLRGSGKTCAQVFLPLARR